MNIFQKQIEKFIGNKNVTENIYRTELHHLIMCAYFCVGFIDFIVTCKHALYQFIFSY